MAVPFIVASMAFQAWSGLQQAEAIRESSALTQKINDLNAKYAEIDAYNAEKFGQTEAARYGTNVNKVIGEQRAGYASQGIDVNSGTAAEMQTEGRTIGMLNMIDLQNQARAKAYGLRIQASNIRLQGGMASNQAAMDASAAQRNGFLSAGLTGLSMYERNKGYKGLNNFNDFSEGDSAESSASLSEE